MRPIDQAEVLADKSAWARAGDPAVAGAWEEELLAGRIGTCPVVVMEILSATRSEVEFTELEAALNALESVPLTPQVTARAIGAMRSLASRGNHHRVPLPDVLVAACAAVAGVGVLHYDRHYDRLAEVLPFESRWIAPAGSIG